jgi:hypothetical protein
MDEYAARFGGIEIALRDVPEEASEVLVTPRERGNEFYRLKKK